MQQITQNIGTHVPDYISVTHPKIVILRGIFQNYRTCLIFWVVKSEKVVWYSHNFCADTSWKAAVR